MTMRLAGTWKRLSLNREIVRISSGRSPKLTSKYACSSNGKRRTDRTLPSGGVRGCALSPSTGAGREPRAIMVTPGAASAARNAPMSTVSLLRRIASPSVIGSSASESEVDEGVVGAERSRHHGVDEDRREQREAQTRARDVEQPPRAGVEVVPHSVEGETQLVADGHRRDHGDGAHDDQLAVDVELRIETHPVARPETEQGPDVGGSVRQRLGAEEHPAHEDHEERVAVTQHARHR